MNVHKVFRCKCSEKFHPMPSNTTGTCIRIRCPDCNNVLYRCKFCSFSSKYRQNVERHIHRFHTFHLNGIEPENRANNENEPDALANNSGDDDSSSSSSEDGADDDNYEFLMNIIDLDVQDSSSTSLNSSDNDLQLDHNLPGNQNTRQHIQFPTFNDNNKSREYFLQEYTHLKATGQPLGGIKGVTWRSIYQTHSYDEQSMLQVEDAKLMFLFADHALNNSGKQKEVFFSIMDSLVNRLRGNNNSLNSFVDCLNDEQKDAFNSIVSSMDQEQTRMYNHMRTGKKLQIKVLPSAAVTIVADHAVVSLDSLIDHIMAQGIPILWKQDENGVVNNTTLNGSPAAADVYAEFQAELEDPVHTTLGLILVWSDGFLRVYVKQKKNSAWIMTIAIPNPDGNSTSIFHTYCIAIGNSSSDHTPVLEYFLKELEVVKREKVRYCGLRGNLVKTSFRMLAYSSDRMERGNLTKTSVGGTFGLSLILRAALILALFHSVKNVSNH